MACVLLSNELITAFSWSTEHCTLCFSSRVGLISSEDCMKEVDEVKLKLKLIGEVTSALGCKFHTCKWTMFCKIPSTSSRNEEIIRCIFTSLCIESRTETTANVLFEQSFAYWFWSWDGSWVINNPKALRTRSSRLWLLLNNTKQGMR